MRWRPLAGCSILEMQQPEKTRLPTVDSLMGGMLQYRAKHSNTETTSLEWSMLVTLAYSTPDRQCCNLYLICWRAEAVPSASLHCCDTEISISLYCVRHSDNSILERFTALTDKAYDLPILPNFRLIFVKSVSLQRLINTVKIPLYGHAIQCINANHTIAAAYRSNLHKSALIGRQLTLWHT